MSCIISLTTDFGTQDPFAGIIKAVALGISPNVRFVDLCHEVEPQNILQASIMLGSSTLWFPRGSIHLAVVDPGVGGQRRALAVQTEDYFYVAPDNGILSSVIDDNSKIYSLDRPEFFLKNISNTFHGRDVFAPVCGWIANGTPLDEMGALISDPVTLNIPRTIANDEGLAGEIISIDRFGNLQTNIRQQEIEKTFTSSGYIVRVDGENIAGPFSYYEEAEPGVCACLINSASVLEVFCKQGNAGKNLQLKPGTPVTLSKIH